MQKVVRLSDNREFTKFVKVNNDVVVQDGDDGLIHLKPNEYRMKITTLPLTKEDAMIAMLQGKLVIANSIMKYKWNKEINKFVPISSSPEFPELNMTNGKVATFNWSIEAETT